MTQKEITVNDRPDRDGITLLQSLHVLREMEDMEIRRLEYGYPDREVNPLHPMAWGLFKASLLKSTKNREDLKKWSPELFEGDKVCRHCNGEGKNDIPKDSPQYIEYVEDAVKDPDFYKDFKMGDPLWSHCSPCQGSGILTKLDQYYDEKKKNEVPA